MNTVRALAVAAALWLALEGLAVWLVHRRRRQDDEWVRGLHDEYLPEHWRQQEIDDLRERIVALTRRVDGAGRT